MTTWAGTEGKEALLENVTTLDEKAWTHASCSASCLETTVSEMTNYISNALLDHTHSLTDLLQDLKRKLQQKFGRSFKFVFVYVFVLFLLSLPFGYNFLVNFGSIVSSNYRVHIQRRNCASLETLLIPHVSALDC